MWCFPPESDCEDAYRAAHGKNPRDWEPTRDAARRQVVMEMLAPLTDPKTGEVILYDIFVAGKWIGSRRTIKQCIETLRNEKWPSAVLATDYVIHDDKIIFSPIVSVEDCR